ncbi:MAG: DUF4037 domain-containing protein [Anaerolineae bacterium]|nr:DUF4037 domain-containing protein [Anaerolineae bacterium]
MIPGEIQLIVDEVLVAVRHFTRAAYGIAVGGAHAKGAEDAESDLDIYLFSEDALPSAERESRVLELCPGAQHIVSWGDGCPFAQYGTDFDYRGLRVECWLRNTELIERAIVESQAGLVRREWVTWTTTGFYNHCALSDVNVMIPIDDPDGILARWKSVVATYPPKLRESIVHTHLQAARFWPSNFHYSSAVERQDVIYTTGIVQQVVHNLIQVLFAINDTYFPGDKKLASALAHLDRVPGNLAARIEALIFPGERPSVVVLQRQQAGLLSLLRDVELIVANEDSH